MHKMTIGDAFSSTTDFFGRIWGVASLGVISVVLLAGLLGYAMIGGEFSNFALGPNPNQDPTQMLALLGRVYLVMFIAIIALSTINFLCWRHGITRGSESVVGNIGWALGAACLYILMSFAISIATLIAFYIILVIVALIAVAIFGLASFSAENLAGGIGTGLGVGAIIAIILLYIVLIIGSLWLNARMSVMGPVMAAERTVNPITGLTRSWTLTKPSQWTIVGFFLLLFICAIIFLLLVGGVGGAMMGSMLGGDGGAAMGAGAIGMMLVMALIYGSLLILWISVPGGIYLALDKSDMDVGSTFA